MRYCAWMTCWSVFAAATLARGADPVDGQVADILQSAKEEGHRVVAICPRPLIVPRDGEEESFAGTIAPSAQQQLEEFIRKMHAGQADYGLRIADETLLVRALGQVNVANLADPAVKRELARQTRADSLVLMRAFEEQGRWSCRFDLVSLTMNSSDQSREASYSLTLSEAGYMGVSFEARRWVDGRLEGVGFDGLTRSEAMGLDPGWEHFQLAKLKPHRVHPLLDESLPYRISIVANGKPVELQEINGELYAALEPTDEIGIRMQNDLEDRVILMALYVDGVNTINQKRELPWITPYSRHWVLQPKTSGLIRGWLDFDPERQVQTYGRFQLVDPDRSVAARLERGDQQGSGSMQLVSYGSFINDEIGQITAVVYTQGWDGIDRNDEPGPFRTLGDPRYGIGEGERAETRTRTYAGERGMLLGALTVKYRSPEQIEQLRRASRDDRPVASVDDSPAKPLETAGSNETADERGAIAAGPEKEPIDPLLARDEPASVPTETTPPPRPSRPADVPSEAEPFPVPGR